MPAISIIVPIYNMERLMRRCIDSLLAQSFKDFELLLIDDGSKDASWSICQEYAEKDPRVFIYHKENGGLSDARNFGLQHAHGKYTIFVDPDDWVDAEGMESLYQTAELTGADMTICDFYSEDEYVSKLIRQQPKSLDRVNVLEELFQDIRGFTWNKLIRTELYNLYNLKYPKNIYGCEDQYLMAELLLHPIKIAYVSVAYYHYMYNPKSLTRYYDQQTYLMDVRVLKMFDSLLRNTSAYPYAHANKLQAIFTRAFWNGRYYYSSAQFKQLFYHYRSFVFSANEIIVVKFAMFLACLGGYQIAIKVVFIMFNVKRILKKNIK